MFNNLPMRVARIHFDESARRPLLLVPEKDDWTKDQPRVLELSMDRSQCDYLGAKLRLTQPGDRIRLSVRTSCNGVMSLDAFENLTLAEVTQ